VKILEADLSVVLIEHLNEPAHMRAFEVVRKIYIHIDPANCVLKFVRPIQNNDRVMNILYPDPVNWNLAMILLVLNIFFHLTTSICQLAYLLFTFFPNVRAPSGAIQFSPQSSQKA